jgi:hypothetical protein
MPANNTIQLTATCYANFAAGDTLSGGVTIHWDTM